MHFSNQLQKPQEFHCKSTKSVKPREVAEEDESANIYQLNRNENLLNRSLDYKLIKSKYNSIRRANKNKIGTQLADQKNLNTSELSQSTTKVRIRRKVIGSLNGRNCIDNEIQQACQPRQSIAKQNFKSFSQIPKNECISPQNRRYIKMNVIEEQTLQQELNEQFTELEYQNTCKNYQIGQQTSNFRKEAQAKQIQILNNSFSVGSLIKSQQTLKISNFIQKKIRKGETQMLQDFIKEQLKYIKQLQSPKQQPIHQRLKKQQFQGRSEQI